MMEKNNWPVWANEDVKIVPFDLKWSQIAMELKAELNILNMVCPIIRIEHIGSTSVEGLSAKPIIDLMAEVESFDKLDLVTELLSVKEWHFVPVELDQRPYRRFFVKVYNNKRIAHLHLMLPDTEKWGEQLLFRNKLRESKHLVNEYSALKLRLATVHAGNREAYTIAKTKFVKEVLSS